MAAFWDPDHPRICEALRGAAFVSCRELPFGSNYSFALVLQSELFDEQGLAIYKPRRGETPLWDFPDGTLCLREYAAYLLASFLGWPSIPPTVLREDGPYGTGSVQLFVDVDHGEHYFTMRERGGHDFRRIVAFDWLTNNADRRGGHCLLGRDGRIWSIDHGLTFNAMPRLRSVIWDYIDEPLPEDVVAGLRSLAEEIDRADGPLAELVAILAPDEVAALRHRALALLEHGRFPDFPEGANWRPVPWPPV